MAAYLTPDDPLWQSVSEALNPVLHLEGEWEQSKLERRIREYFRKAAKGLEFTTQPWWKLVNAYADNVYSSMFQALRDREWLENVDFVLAMDAAIKDAFPAKLIDFVPEDEFERAVLAANDRAFEEQRYLPALWQLCSDILPKGKLRRRIYDAIEQGRKVAVGKMGNTDDPNEMKAFLSAWVDVAVKTLSRTNYGDPASIMEEDSCVEIFHGLLQAGALPIILILEHGTPPVDWPFVEYVVHQAYLAHDRSDRIWAEIGKGGGKRRKNGKGKAKAIEDSKSEVKQEVKEEPAGQGGTDVTGIADDEEEDNVKDEENIVCRGMNLSDGLDDIDIFPVGSDDGGHARIHRTEDAVADITSVAAALNPEVEACESNIKKANLKINWLRAMPDEIRDDEYAPKLQGAEDELREAVAAKMAACRSQPAAASGDCDEPPPKVAKWMPVNM